MQNLKGDKLVVDYDVLREKVGANCCFVVAREFPIDKLIHQRRLAHSANDNIDKEKLPFYNFFEPNLFTGVLMGTIRR